jgi:hypothetical protein
MPFGVFNPVLSFFLQLAQLFSSAVLPAELSKSCNFIGIRDADSFRSPSFSEGPLDVTAHWNNFAPSNAKRPGGLAYVWLQKGSMAALCKPGLRTERCHGSQALAESPYELR